MCVSSFACPYSGTVTQVHADEADFSLFLKSLKDANGNPLWSVTSVNAIPIGGSAITVVTVWVYSFLSDYFQTRWLIVMIQAVWGIVPCIILSVWNVPLGAKYFSCTFSSHRFRIILVLLPLAIVSEETTRSRMCSPESG